MDDRSDMKAFHRKQIQHQHLPVSQMTANLSLSYTRTNARTHTHEKVNLFPSDKYLTKLS
jgi:hypothetical protein